MTRRLSKLRPANLHPATCGPASVSRSEHRGRRGFSMIELLIVITIIAILAGLLLSAVTAGITRARVAQVVAEMKNLEQAIKQFEAEFGMQPPSFIVIHESAVGWTATDADTRSSRAILRQMWPNFEFTTMGDSASAPAPVSFVNPVAGNNAIDLNSNNVEGDRLTLCGSECLAFFLGGIQDRETKAALVNTASLVGFSKVPTAPLSRMPSGGSAFGPYYEFNSRQLVDLDADGMPEYVDAIPGQERPLQYLTSYGGTGYRPYGRDGNHGTADDELLTNSMLWIYTRTQGTSASAPADPFNPKSFQIISPGFDGEYGVGGFVDPEKGVKDGTIYLPVGHTPTTVVRANGSPPNTLYERDNIVNFLSTELH